MHANLVSKTNVVISWWRRKLNWSCLLIFKRSIWQKFNTQLIIEEMFFQKLRVQQRPSWNFDWIRYIKWQKLYFPPPKIRNKIRLCLFNITLEIFAMALEQSTHPPTLPQTTKCTYIIKEQEKLPIQVTQLLFVQLSLWTESKKPYIPTSKIPIHIK